MTLTQGLFFYLAHPHLFWQVCADVFLMTVIAINMYTLRRSQKSLRDIERFNRDKAPIMVSSMERMACQVCPFCAVAAGMGEMKDDDGPMVPESESDGNHMVRDGRGREHGVPCMASDLRKCARMIVEDSMDGKAGMLLHYAVGIDEGLKK